MTRRRMLHGLAAALVPALPGSALSGPALSGPAATPRRGKAPVCGLDLGAAAIPSAAAWDRAFEARWGPLGRQTRRQIDSALHNRNGVYDDRGGEFAWIVHYWIRAWVAMAALTGNDKYLAACVSFIDYMLDHTDARRVRRGEIVEAYVRDPLYLRGSGRGGPFWKRGDDAIVLNTGQISHGILRFVDAVYADRGRWAAFVGKADTYFAQARIAVDAFDNDWQVFDDKGSYHYRDDRGSGRLGVTRAAFNQSATMMSAQILLNRWRPDAARADKIRRLANYWIDDFATPGKAGTLVWRYMIHPEITVVEDVGHAGVDLDFLLAAYDTGLTGLTRDHMERLARTYLVNVVDGRGGLNRFVDGTTTPGFDEHWNAAIGWFGLARLDPAVADAALRVYNRRYRAESAPGVLWARPMLGWANLLAAARAC